MSTYCQKTKNPKTGEFELAVWIDDCYGHHNYGVKFADGSMYNPDVVPMETRQDGRYTHEDMERLLGLKKKPVDEEAIAQAVDCSCDCSGPCPKHREEDVKPECTCPDNVDYAAGPDHVCKPDTGTSELICESESCPLRETGRACCLADATGWEAEFDEKFKDTRKGVDEAGLTPDEEIINYMAANMVEKWEVKAFIRVELSKARAEAAKPDTGTAAYCAPKIEQGDCKKCGKLICDIPFCSQQRVSEETALGINCPMSSIRMGSCHGHPMDAGTAGWEAEFDKTFSFNHYDAEAIKSFIREEIRKAEARVAEQILREVALELKSLQMNPDLTEGEENCIVLAWETALSSVRDAAAKYVNGYANE